MSESQPSVINAAVLVANRLCAYCPGVRGRKEEGKESRSRSEPQSGGERLGRTKEKVIDFHSGASWNEMTSPRDGQKEMKV